MPYLSASIFWLETIIPAQIDSGPGQAGRRAAVIPFYRGIEYWQLKIFGIALRGVGLQPLRARFQPVGFIGLQAGGEA